MKNKFIVLLLLNTTPFLAQERLTENQKQQREIVELTRKITHQETVINQQKKDITSLVSQLSVQKKNVDSLDQKIKTTSQQIEQLGKELGSKMDQIESNSKTSIYQLDQNVATNRMYWIIGTLGTLALGGGLFWWLGRRISMSKTDVETQIKNTKKSLEEETIKLDSKLVDVLETQLKIQQEQKSTTTVEVTNEVDHSLALKVADEIIRMQKNISNMDSNTKGLKPLIKGIERIQDNFASNGYELVEMLGKEYNEGMKAVPNFIPSEDLETGKQIITRIIKPQVNFKNEMIQAAQIEVSVGE